MTELVQEHRRELIGSRLTLGPFRQDTAVDHLAVDTDAIQVGLHALGQGAIRQQVVETGVDKGYNARLGGEGRALGDLLDPGRRSLDVSSVDVAHI